MASTSDEATTTTTELDERSDSSSSQDEKCDKFIAVDYEFVIGAREKSKLLWIPSEKQFYIKNRQTKSGMAYLCSVETCKIRVYMKGDVCNRLISDVHNHVNAVSDYNKWKALNEVKALVVQDRKTAPREIWNEVMSR